MPEQEKQKLWFRAKDYGYGWYPATWEGWTAVAIHLVLVAAGALVLSKYIAQAENDPNPLAAIIYFATVCGLTGILIWICYKKGEKPAWHWPR